MSVILDSLRRARGGGAPAPRTPSPAPAPSAVARAIPSALRAVSRAQPRRQTGSRWKLVAAVVVLGLGVWATLQLSLGLSVPQPAARPAATGAAAEPITPQRVAAEVLKEFVPGIELPKQTEMKDLAPVPSSALKGADAAADPPPVAPTPAATGAPRRAATSKPLPPAPAALPAALTLPAVTAAPPAAVRINHLDLGIKAQQLGNFGEAVSHYQRAIEENDSNIAARNNLGLLYSERGLLEEAIEQLRRATRIDRTYIPAWSNLAVVLTKAGRLEEAKAAIRDAQAVAPRDVGLLVNLANIEIKAKQPELARETLLRAIGIDSKHPEANLNLAILYEEAGNLSKAREHYEKFLTNAGSEYGQTLTDVRNRIDEIAPKLNR